MGPFRITKIILPIALQIQLPPSWRIHNTFHISLLEPYRTDSQKRPNINQLLREAESVEDSKYKVDKILDAIRTARGVKYLVRWQGWPAKKHWTWEPKQHFNSPGSKRLLKQYHVDHPGKPRDMPRGRGT